MAKHQSESDRANHAQLTSIANGWHKCERFLMKGVQCPYRTAGIEEDVDNPPESRRSPILLGPPARRRQLQTNLADITEDAKTFDIRDFVNLPIPEPALPEGPRPDRPIPGPIPGLPRPEVPQPLNVDIPRLPDGMPIINAPPSINPNQIGRLIQFLNQNFITGLANKPAFSRPPLTNPLPKNLPMRGNALDSFLLQEFAETAASEERTFATQFASSMKPVKTIEREVNRDSSARRESEGEGRSGITRRQIVGAGAAIAAGVAGAAAVNAFRGGGGGGMSFPSRFPRDPAMAR